MPQLNMVLVDTRGHGMIWYDAHGMSYKYRVSTLKRLPMMKWCMYFLVLPVRGRRSEGEVQVSQAHYREEDKCFTATIPFFRAQMIGRNPVYMPIGNTENRRKDFSVCSCIQEVQDLLKVPSRTKWNPSTPLFCLQFPSYFLLVLPASSSRQSPLMSMLTSTIVTHLQTVSLYFWADMSKCASNRAKA